ncbi:TPA: hypothetical protein KC789_001106 [Escherichia coli O146]|nr:hypothetical protein [Escherichia coli O146]
MDNSKLKKMLITSIIVNILLVFLNIQVFNQKHSSNVIDTQKKEDKSKWADIENIYPVCKVHNNNTSYSGQLKPEWYCYWFNPITYKYTYLEKTLITSTSDGVFYFSNEYTPTIELRHKASDISVPVDIYAKQLLDRLERESNAKIFLPKEAKQIKSEKLEKWTSFITVIPKDNSKDIETFLLSFIKKEGVLWTVFVEYPNDDKKYWYIDEKTFDLIDKITSTF